MLSSWKWIDPKGPATLHLLLYEKIDEQQLRAAQLSLRHVVFVEKVEEKACLKVSHIQTCFSVLTRTGMKGSEGERLV